MEAPSGCFTVESLFHFDAVHILTAQKGDLCVSILTDAPGNLLEQIKKVPHQSIWKLMSLFAKYLDSTACEGQCPGTPFPGHQ